MAREYSEALPRPVDCGKRGIEGNRRGSGQLTATCIQIRPDPFPVQPIAAEELAISQQYRHPRAVFALELRIRVDMPYHDGASLQPEHFGQFPKHFLAKGAVLAGVNQPIGHLAVTWSSFGGRHLAAGAAACWRLSAES